MKVPVESKPKKIFKDKNPEENTERHKDTFCYKYAIKSKQYGNKKAKNEDVVIEGRIDVKRILYTSHQRALWRKYLGIPAANIPATAPPLVLFYNNFKNGKRQGDARDMNSVDDEFFIEAPHGCVPFSAKSSTNCCKRKKAVL